MQFQTSDFFTKEFSQSFLLKFLTPLFLHVHVRAHLKGGWREIPLRKHRATAWQKKGKHFLSPPALTYGDGVAAGAEPELVLALQCHPQGKGREKQ